MIRFAVLHGPVGCFDNIDDEYLTLSTESVQLRLVSTLFTQMFRVCYILQSVSRSRCSQTLWLVQC